MTVLGGGSFLIEVETAPNVWAECGDLTRVQKSNNVTISRTRVFRKTYRAASATDFVYTLNGLLNYADPGQSALLAAERANTSIRVRWTENEDNAAMKMITARVATITHDATPAPGELQTISFELRSAVAPTDFSVLPSSIRGLFDQINLLGAGQLVDLYVDGSSVVPAIAAAGLASLTVVNDGTFPEGKKVTSWDSAIFPGTGKHWRPSAGMTGANTDGLTVKGQGLELPASTGYTGGAAGFHNEDTALTVPTPGAGGNLMEFLHDYTSGIEVGALGKIKANTMLFEFGETSADADYRFFSADHIYGQQQALSDYAPLASWGQELTSYATRARAIVSKWFNATTTRGWFEVIRVGRDFYNPYGGAGIGNGTQPRLNAAQRLRMLIDQGWAVAPHSGFNVVWITKGRLNAAQRKTLCDTLAVWYPDIVDDTRPNIVLFGGDSVPSTLLGPGNSSNARDLIVGIDGSPGVPNTAYSGFPQAGNTNRDFQWPFIRMYYEDGDPSLRTRCGLNHFEVLNDQASLNDNYYVFDRWRAQGAKFKGVIRNFAYSNYQNITIGQADIADIVAHWNLHADAYIDEVTGYQMFSAFNFADGHDSAESGHAYPVGQNPLMWASWHPLTEQLRCLRQTWRSGMRYLIGLDPSADTVRATVTPDHVTLTSGAPTSNPAISNPLNWQGVAVSGKTWTHSTIFGDGSSAAAVATVDADGTLHRVAVGHCLRLSISNDGARVYCDVNCT